MGGQGRSLPPCKRPREGALLEAERSHQSARIAHLDWELLGGTLRCGERDFENRNLRWQLAHRDHRARARASGVERSIDILRWRLERRVEVLKEENEDLRERAALAGVRVDELEEDLDRARGAR